MSAFEILKHVAASCLGVLIAISFKGLLDHVRLASTELVENPV